jgi:hypothetical protein
MPDIMHAFEGYVCYGVLADIGLTVNASHEEKHD